jgi:ADP-ribosyl-[dinitrogen reductase] hydrolase
MGHPSPSILGRAHGTLVGLAVGDALGTTLEFSRRDSHPMHTEMTGGGPFRLLPGVWTDDTSMALALADSLIACPSFDAADLMGRFVDWWREGRYSPTFECFDIGVTTATALRRYVTTGNPFAGDEDENSAGNGSIMRLAPVALRALNDPEACRRLAADQSRTTHAAPQAVQSCIFFAEKLRRAILGEPKDTILAPTVWSGHEVVRAVACGDWRGRKRDEIISSGYVVHTLEAALWAVDETDSFEDALILAVNLADDSDTVGAVTGQLAGAIYGLSAVPDRWLAPLAWREEIIGRADALLNGKCEGPVAETGCPPATDFT